MPRNHLRMPALTVLALMSAGGAAQPARETPPADPLFHVELIAFVRTTGNPAEEDLTHGSPLPLDQPEPRRLRLPRIELETVLDLGAEVEPDPRREPVDAEDVAAGGNAADAARANAAASRDTAPGSGAGAVPGDALELFERPGDAASGPGARRPGFDGPVAFAPLAPGALELGALAARLARNSNYRVLAHVGWIQAGVDQERAAWLDLQRLGVNNPTGSVRLRLGRFWFVALDLAVFDGQGSLWSAPAGPGLAPLVRAPRYTLDQEQTAIRNGQYVLFDHPLLGVLIRITPAPEPEDEGGPAAGEPAA